MRHTLLVSLALILLGPSLSQAGPPPEMLNVRTALFSGATATDAGQRITLRLSDRRTGWNHSKYAVHKFSKPKDLSDVGSIQLTVRTDKPRTDVGVYLALKEADGSWHYHPWACELDEKDNIGTARLADFHPAHWTNPENPWSNTFDENNRLDPERISAVAIGTVNPMGVGEVTFELTGLRMYPKPVNAKTDRVAVDVTGELLTVNGTEHIPAGVFGGFHLGGGRHAKYRLAMDRHIFHDPHSASFRKGNEVTHIQLLCVGDRVRPSVRLTDPNWQANSTKTGTRLGEQIAAAGGTGYVEYWNEPYLNWANRNRANFIPRYYDQSKAVEGGPVHINHDGQVAPHLKWTKDYTKPLWQWVRNKKDWRRGKDEGGKVYGVHAPPYNRGMSHFYGGNWTPQYHPPADVKDGQTYTVKVRGKPLELTAFTPWHVYDETQMSYWSGKGMVKLYLDPMLALGKALKAKAPRATFIAGWGNRPSENRWAGFHNLYKPVLDAGIDVIDAVHDHDYGGNATKMSANYEVICAYGVTQHDKWLTSYNTECASSSDPQAYRSAGANPDAAKFRWTATKILDLLAQCPDKARGVAWFGTGGGFWSDQGEGRAMEMMINLRGRLVRVDTSDPDILAVAAIDGTDPANPRPKSLPDRKELVVAVMNTSGQPRDVDLTVQAPGTTFTGQIWKQSSQNGDKLSVESKTDNSLAGKTAAAVAGTLAPGELWVLTYPLADAPKDAPKVVRTQHFLTGVLHEVTPEKPAKGLVKIDPARLKGAKRAWVKIVAERLDHGEGQVVINGTSYALPAAVTAENAPQIRQLAIPVEAVKPVNTVEFRCKADRAGWLLGMGSIVVETQGNN